MATEPDQDISTIDLDPYSPQSTKSSAGFAWTMALGAVLLIGLFLLWLNLPNIDEGSTIGQFAVCLGNFHPIVIHFPVALLIVALFVEILGRTPLAKGWRNQGGLLLWIGTIGAVVAVLFGYTLGIVDEWRSSTFDTHQWTGIGVAATALLATLFRSVDRQGLSLLALAVSVGFVSVAGYMGGELTHGRDHLTKHLPDVVKSTLGMKTDGQGNGGPTQMDPLEADPVIFTSLIVPMLERSCVECHGEEDQDGELRVDSYEALFLRGESEEHGIVAGDLDSSEIYFRVTLDPDDDDYMPTKGDPLAEEEVKILAWWIKEAKASETARVSEVDRPKEIQSILAAKIESKGDSDA